MTPGMSDANLLFGTITEMSAGTQSQTNLLSGFDNALSGPSGNAGTKAGCAGPSDTPAGSGAGGAGRPGA